MNFDKDIEKQPAELMELAKNGDAKAFAKLYQMYFTPVYRYIYIRTRNKTEAEDLTQTVFLKTLQTLGGFKNLGRPPLAYFFTAARHTVINFWRKKKEIPASDAEQDFLKAPYEKDNPQALAEAQEQLNIIKSSLADLTDEQQEIITLKFISELTNKEIGAITGKSEAAIRQLQFRALRELKKHFKQHESH